MNIKEQKVEPKKEVVNPKEKEEKKWREIVIHTNGTDIHIVKAEVAGNIEFIAILQSLIGAFANKK